MSTPARRRLLERHAEEVDVWFAGQGPDLRSDDEVEAARRRNRLEALRAVDPSASLVEELVVRLTGEAAGEGGLGFGVGDVLLRPLEEGVSGVAGQPVALSLTGVSRGSTVLHVRATARPSTQETEPDQMPSDTSEADPAVREFLSVVGSLETGEGLDRARGKLAALDRLVGALNRYDLSMAMTWSAFNGDVRSARLSEAGRARYGELARTRTEAGTRVLSGRVTELREAGVFKVKEPGGPNSRAYEVRVERDRLLDMHLELGAPVSVRVREERQVDQAGVERSVSYVFLEHVSSEPGLFEP